MQNKFFTKKFSAAMLGILVYAASCIASFIPWNHASLPASFISSISSTAHASEKNSKKTDETKNKSVNDKLLPTEEAAHIESADEKNSSKKKKSTQFVNLNEIRFGSNVQRDRLVFDFDALPKYTVRTTNDGKRIILIFENIRDLIPTKHDFHSDAIRSIRYKKNRKNFVVVITLKEQMDSEVNVLDTRVYIDVLKEYELQLTETPAYGLSLTTYTKKNGNGLLTAYLLDVDLRFYKIQPELANGMILGRDTVSHIAHDIQATAAINASYFSPNGEIYGVTKMRDVFVGTTYIKRSALGIREDGTMFIAPVSFGASVTINGETHWLSGIDCERGKDNLILYNHVYNVSTGTNNFGREILVRHGKIAAFRQANTPLPKAKDAYVLSMHGAAKNFFRKAKIGDKVELNTLVEDASVWKDVPVIVGAGPSLVSNGKVFVTNEEFPSDITQGRAPRTGIALVDDAHVLLAVVDGRQSHSIGCTLEEFAELLVKFGAKEALNFDGGGSSAIVVNEQLLNSPSDGAERKIGSVLAVYKKS